MDFFLYLNVIFYLNKQNNYLDKMFYHKPNRIIYTHLYNIYNTFEDDRDMIFFVA